MNFISKNKGLIVVIVVVLALIGFFYKTNNKSADAKTVDVGVISILSGQFAALGENYVNGVKLAAEEFNNTTKGPKVNLIVEDDGYDPKKGVSAYKKLTAVDKIDALVNVSTVTVDAVHADINAQQLPTVQFGIQTSEVKDDYIFQITPSPESIIKGFATYIKRNVPLQKVAVVYENAAVFEGFRKVFLETYGEGTVTSFRVSSKDDIQIYASTIVAQKFDGVVILTMPETGALMIKRISSLTKTPPQYLIDGQLSTGEESYKSILGSLAPLNGTYSIWLAESDNSKFKKNYLAKYGAEAGTFADTGYDAFNTLIAGYDTDASDWARKIKKTDTVGATGRISFNEEGTRYQDLEIKRVKEGKMITEAKINMSK